MTVLQTSEFERRRLRLRPTQADAECCQLRVLSTLSAADWECCRADTLFGHLLSIVYSLEHCYVGS